MALLAEFDADRNGRLSEAERRAARARAESLGLNRGRGGRNVGTVNAAPGLAVTPESVRPYPTTQFYDTGTIRTLFLTFENNEWERELMAFKRTDIDVPATLTVDGRAYQDVGVQFHGNSSFSGVPLGLKHSMRIALDLVKEKQDVESYNTLLLLNSHEDPSFLRTLLALEIARDYIPAPRANLVRVVINGESWGIFTSQQQFNKDLTREWFKTTDGARWKVPGSPGNRGAGLSYLGDDAESYKGTYEIKSKDDPASWAALINLTRVLNQTAPDRLEAALAPILDVDGALKFLAIDNVLVNSDGYWTRASDYSLYMEPGGRFHVMPYDVNTTFISGGGRGGFGRGGSVNLDPLQAMNDPSKALASKLLAVPGLRAKYLGYVRDIATKWLDWNTLGPRVARYQALIDADVKVDTRKLYSYEQFVASTEALRYFADARRAALLDATVTP
ncbi:MAG: CotH kinase family protein [Vicinamibacterales bacterium]